MKIEAAYSTLNPAALLELAVAQYDIVEPQTCKFWVRGLNDTYLVTTAQSKFILRVYRQGWRTNEEIAFEIDALNYLHRRGAKVAYPIQRKQGGYITDVVAPEGKRQLIMTSYAEGAVLDFNESDNAKLFGASVAELHLHSAEFNPAHQRFQLDLAHLLTEPLATIAALLPSYKADVQFMTDCADTLFANVTTASAQLERGLCHGDTHGYNTHAHNGELTHFDFDCCGMGWLIYDLAIFKWHARRNQAEETWWPAFLEGYQSVRAIPKATPTTLESLIAIREIWLMAIHLNSAPVFPRNWLNADYVKQRTEFLKDSLARIDLL